MKKRKDIDYKYKWDLKEYFANNEEWEEEFKNFSEDILKIKEFNGKLKDSENILSCLKLIENLETRAEALYVYANCLKDLNVAEAKSQEMLNKIEQKLTEYYVLSSFVNSQLSKLTNSN